MIFNPFDFWLSFMRMVFAPPAPSAPESQRQALILKFPAGQIIFTVESSTNREGSSNDEGDA